MAVRGVFQHLGSYAREHAWKVSTVLLGLTCLALLIWLADAGEFGGGYDEAVGGTVAEWTTGLLTAIGLLVAAVEVAHDRSEHKKELEVHKAQLDMHLGDQLADRRRMASQKQFGTSVAYQWALTQWRKKSEQPDLFPELPDITDVQAWATINVTVKCYSLDANIRMLRVVIDSVKSGLKVILAPSQPVADDATWGNATQVPSGSWGWRESAQPVGKVADFVAYVLLVDHPRDRNEKQLDLTWLAISVEYLDETDGWVRSELYPSQDIHLVESPTPPARTVS